jgi:hypothetical protein
MLASGDLECALRSLADLVQFVPKGIDLPLDLWGARKVCAINLGNLDEA